MDAQEFVQLRCRIESVLTRQLFFVCGAPKSGTTWLQRLLDAHPEVVCSGEGHFGDKLGDLLSQAIGHYNNQQRLVARLVYEGHPYYSGLDRRHLDYTLLSLMCLLMAQRPIGPRVKCVGDKTPRSTFFLDLLWRVKPDAKVIQIVRDGRDVVVSSLHHARRSGVEDALDRDSPKFPDYVRDYAKVWADNIGAARRAAAQRAGLYHELRYEALQAEPVATLQAAARFLGVDAAPEIMEACRQAADFKKLSGRARGEEDKASFFRKGVAGDWRNYFDARAREAFEQAAGDLLRELGYRWD